MKISKPQRILIEDLDQEDVAKSISEVVGPTINRMIDDIYLALSKNIDVSNLAVQVKDVTFSTKSDGYHDPISFNSTLAVRAFGCTIMQCLEKPAFIPIETKNPAWIENASVITVSNITGLKPSKSYLIRFKLE
jgi:hypothetical protein